MIDKEDRFSEVRTHEERINLSKNRKKLRELRHEHSSQSKKRKVLKIDNDVKNLITINTFSMVLCLLDSLCLVVVGSSWQCRDGGDRKWRRGGHWKYHQRLGVSTDERFEQSSKQAQHCATTHT